MSSSNAGRPDSEVSGDLEMSDLGALVQEMRAKQGAVEWTGRVQLAPRSWLRRLPLLQIGLVAVGIYLLFRLYPGFAYWLQPAESENRGEAIALVAGDSWGDLDNKHVAIHGAPISENRATVTSGDSAMDFLPLRQTGGRLWVAIPGGEEGAGEVLERDFVGRSRRFRKIDDYVHVTEALRDGNVVNTFDTTPQALMQSLAKSDAGGGDSLSLGPDDRVHLVLAEAEVTVQLGKKTWKSVDDAEKVVAGLGYPFQRLEKDKQPFHRFVARVPPSDRDRVRHRLRDELPKGTSPGSPSLGAAIVPRSQVFKVRSNDLTAEGQNLSIPVTDDMTPGYVLNADGKLIEREESSSGRLAIGLAELSTVRVERPVSIPSDAFVLLANEKPSDELFSALLWIIVVVGVIAVPLLPFVVKLMRSREADVET